MLTTEIRTLRNELVRALDHSAEGFRVQAANQILHTMNRFMDLTWSLDQNIVDEAVANVTTLEPNRLTSSTESQPQPKAAHPLGNVTEPNPSRQAPKGTDSTPIPTTKLKLSTESRIINLHGSNHLEDDVEGESTEARERESLLSESSRYELTQLDSLEQNVANAIGRAVQCMADSGWTSESARAQIDQVSYVASRSILVACWPDQTTDSVSTVEPDA